MKPMMAIGIQIITRPIGSFYYFNNNNHDIMKLSPYTIAKNCTDISDVNVGITELKAYFSKCERDGIAPLITANKRMARLYEKLAKLNGGSAPSAKPTSMIVSINHHEYTQKVLTVHWIDADDNDGVEKIPINKFSYWCDREGLLKGESETCTGPDHEGNPTYFTRKYRYYVTDILSGDSHFDVEKLLVDFMNYYFAKQNNQ